MNSSAKYQYPGTTTAYMPNFDPPGAANLRIEDDYMYMVTSKILVAALVILFAVVLFVICLHIYARCIWRIAQDGRRVPDSAPFSYWPSWRNRDSPSEQFDADANGLEISMAVGLDKSALEALPTFRYKRFVTSLEPTKTGVVECAICLGEFAEGEMGRTLPKCGHSFHLRCIDMWLHSHSTCPLCRAILDRDEEESQRVDIGAAGEQAFRLEPMRAPRRLRGSEPEDRNSLPELVPGNQMDEHTRVEPLPESLQPSPRAQEHDTPKRTDAIPANVLFWGSHSRQSSAESRVYTAVQTSTQTPFQVEVDIVSMNHHVHVQRLQVPSVDLPRGSPPSAYLSDWLVSPVARTVATVRRLRNRGRLPASAATTATTTEDGPEESAGSSSA